LAEKTLGIPLDNAIRFSAIQVLLSHKSMFLLKWTSSASKCEIEREKFSLKLCNDCHKKSLSKLRRLIAIHGDKLWPTLWLVTVKIMAVEN
jgi:hypothetical protein